MLKTWNYNNQSVSVAPLTILVGELPATLGENLLNSGLKQNAIEFWEPGKLNNLAPGRGLVLLDHPYAESHPRKQAELATRLCKLIKESEAWYVVKTYSDYFLDRVRMEVRDKLIAANKVQILHFDGTKFEVISLKEDGNIEPVQGYRAFQLGEEQRLLGIK